MSGVLAYDAIVGGLVAQGVPRPLAETTAKRELGIAAEPIAMPDVDEGALEREIEAAGDKLMQKLGFEVIRFSHPGKTKQTEGIADRRYYRRPRVVARYTMPGSSDVREELGPAVTLWWEAKSETGRQRPGQKLFEELVTACGEPYVVGTHEALIDWLVAQRIAVRTSDGLEPWAG